VTPEPTSSDVFVTDDETLVGALSAAVEAVVGAAPALSTAGGTSDARFIKDHCPVVEFGPVGATMHAVDEHVSLADLELTTRIYEAFLDRFFP
jgi:succinyl-diaminopimelate desuccinylase